MAESAEGIGGRKWSVGRAGTSGRMTINEGATVLAELTPQGEAVFNLLVTAPQLWDAANDLIKTMGTEGGPRATFAPEQRQKLANMVAKAVNKDEWAHVAQAE